MVKDGSEIPKPKSISGKRFKDILERLNISEVFLAERSGVSRNTIIKVRNNEPVRESSIIKLSKTIGIRRSDIEENFEQAEEQEHVINGPRGWKIIEALTPTYTCDNGLEYGVVKVQSELIEQKIVRGKLYDLALVAPEARTAMREQPKHLRSSRISRWSQFSFSSSNDRKRSLKDQAETHHRSGCYTNALSKTRLTSSRFQKGITLSRQSAYLW